MSAVLVPEKIIQCLSEAESDDHDTQERGLRTLASITKVSPQNRSLVAQTEGAIAALLALSKSSSSIIQVLSLATLFNLSLNPELKRSLASMETISQLNSTIASPRATPEGCRLASSLVCSLAMLDKNKAKFGVAGTVQLLIDAISGLDRHGPAAHHLLSSLAELVVFHGNSTLAVRSGAVPALLRVAESPTASQGGEDLVGTSLAVLCLVARFDEGLKALTKTDGIVGRLVEVLRERSMFSKEGAADILIRLFDESEGCVRDAMRLPEFATLLADLSVRGSPKAREKASLLMKKLMDAAAHVDSYGHLHQWMEAHYSFPPLIEF